MKYALIIAAILIISRIDFFVGLLERGLKKMDTVSSESELLILPNETPLISIKEDLNLKRSPRELFLSLIQDFHNYPNSLIREKALDLLQKNPKMFGETLDTNLESYIFQWRELLTNNNQETILFLFDLLENLKGENQNIIRRFLSTWMEIDLDKFIISYSKTKDVNCSIATILTASNNDEITYLLYKERAQALDSYLMKESLSEEIKAFVRNCRLQLEIVMEKLKPLNPVSGESVAPTPEDPQEENP